MEALRRDLHASTAACSSVLTRYSKLAQQVSTSYAASGLVKDDLAQRKRDLELELTAALDTVRPLPSSSQPASWRGGRTRPPHRLEVGGSRNSR